MLRHWLGLSVICFAFNVHARDVSISLENTQTTLVLTNPSTVSVNYDIVCHKADGSSTLLNLTSQTLAPNAKVTHNAAIADSGKCAGGTTASYQATDTAGKNYYLCSGSETYANANNACGVGNSFCFPDVSFNVYPCGCGAFWLKNGGDEQYMPPCGSYGAVTVGKQVAVGNFGGGMVKKDSASSPCAAFGYALDYTTSTTNGAVCCSSPVTGSVCKITINTTATNAFLASPSFMGGAAF